MYYTVSDKIAPAWSVATLLLLATVATTPAEAGTDSELETCDKHASAEVFRLRSTFSHLADEQLVHDRDALAHLQVSQRLTLQWQHGMVSLQCWAATA